MTYAITSLANSIFYSSQYNLNLSAKRYGIETIFCWTQKELKRSNFYTENQKILESKRGIGYWLWKPYIILESFKRLQEGDLVVYSDTGIEIINDLTPLFKICEETSIVLFNNCDYQNRIWTKRDCFILMDCDKEKYWSGIHLDAAIQIYKVCDESRSFLQEWLKFGSIKQIIDDGENKCGKENFQEFKEHRWDQSILSLLAIKHNLEIFRCPTQFGNYYKLEKYRIKEEFSARNHYSDKNEYANIPFKNSEYGTLLNHHRTKKQLNLIQRYVYENFRIIPGI